MTALATGGAGCAPCLPTFCISIFIASSRSSIGALVLPAALSTLVHCRGASARQRGEGTQYATAALDTSCSRSSQIPQPLTQPPGDRDGTRLLTRDSSLNGCYSSLVAQYTPEHPLPVDSLESQPQLSETRLGDTCDRFVRTTNTLVPLEH